MSTLLPSSAPENAAIAAAKAASAAKAAMSRKREKTPLEDALESNDDGGQRMVNLVHFIRNQKTDYDAKLVRWRQNRLQWAEEAQDIFTRRAAVRKEQYHTQMEDDAMGNIFNLANESVNIVASLAEFAAAQAEQDIYGGEPWFAANPVGRNDQKLADDIQRHLQWTFRDGRYVDAQCQSIDHAVALGEAFMKQIYEVDADEYEASVSCLHANGKPLWDKDGALITTNEQAKTIQIQPTDKLEWKKALETRQTIIRQGVEALPIHFNDISFREDAPELDLRYTNVYLTVEMSTFEAMRKFKLSKEDALRLAQAARTDTLADPAMIREMKNDSMVITPVTDNTSVTMGAEDSDRLMNTRVRLIEAYIRGDALGNGKESRMCVVVPPLQEDWIIYADYLANISPKAELPVKVEVWEPVPHRLYGRGFFAKYAYLQTGTDNLWNQVNFRNEMHANPLTAVHEENLQMDEDGGALVIGPGKTLRPKANKTLADCIEFATLPDADNRSMELFQTGMQIAQLRSGITSASQGDMSALPENNTATGIRSLISRAAVLLKKPIRRLRRAKGRGFSYAVKLTYANFDRVDAFVWGEGNNAEMVEMTPEKVKDLDIDVTMLLTQEQNQTKLQGAQVLIQLLQAYAGLPESDKAGAKVGIVQALKALEFSNPEQIVRDPIVDIPSLLKMLPPDQAQLLMQAMQAIQAAPPPPANAGQPAQVEQAPASASEPSQTTNSTPSTQPDTTL